MRIWQKGWLAVFLFGFLSMAWASSAPPVWLTKEADNQTRLRVDLFLSTTCPHCQQADHFFQKIESTTPWIQVNRYFIDKDKAAIETFYQYQKNEGTHDFIVPSVFFCNTRWVGFSDIDKSGDTLLKGLTYCRDAIQKTGILTPGTHQILTQMSYESTINNNPSVTWFLPFMAISDAMDYTVLYSIMVLLAFMLIQKKRSDRIATLFLFLLGTGLAHHLQQVHPGFALHSMVALRWPLVLLGIALIAYVAALHHRGLAKKRTLVSLVSLLMVVLTAFAVQLYQQNPSLNFQPDFSVIFQQWLLKKNYAFFHQLAYELIYQVVYLGIITLFAGGLWALLCMNKRMEKHQIFIRETGWTYLAIIGLILIFIPVLLTEGAFAFVSIALALVATWLGFKTWLK